MKRATDHLETLIQGIKNQNPKTLAYWRVTHKPIYQVLHDFATTDSESDDSASSHQVETLLPQVQVLFDALNAQLSLQESEDADYQAYLKSKSSADTITDAITTSSDVSIVFGGKYPEEGKPRSISERLVTKLTASEKANVITVSRSNISYDLPANCRHVSLQCLDHADVSVGSTEFGQVLAMTGIEPKKESSEQQGLNLYLTLGQHKGVDPFRRNLQGAYNFCSALEKYLDSESDGIPRKDGCRWRVVLTGTDATLPSDYPASPVQLSKESLEIPSYKIMKYNFTYAMSKLGQYFLLIKTVAQLTGRTDIVREVEPIVTKIQASVDSAGENGDYSPPENDQDEVPATFISMEELDQYSRRTMELEHELRDHLQFAKGISICYTPLHAVPWTQQAIASAKNSDSLSPKAFVLEQVVTRLKNAISIDQAVECHFK